jgi:hypothetical protein
MILIKLENDLRRQAAHRAIDISPDGHEVEIKAASKTRAQERAYHAIFRDVAQQCKHLNQCFDLEGWKRLLVDQFRTEMLALLDCDEDIRADLEGAVKMVPSLDGRSIVSIGLQTRRFRKKTASALMEWLHSWVAQNGVRLSTIERAQK